MLEAIDLTKQYEDGVLALEGLSLKVSPGEIYCLLGANGAGKTTTINLFLDFIRPTRGRALVKGVDCAERPLEAKEHLAYLSENVTLYGNFTARQNLVFFARLGGRTDLGRDECRAILQRVGLPDRAVEQRVRSFSKGMRQKLGIAIAISKRAPALLLDEPMSGLDPKAAAELVDVLAGLRDQGRSILMSTHDIFRARQLADRVGIMRGGRKVAELDRDELERTDLEALYLDIMRDREEPVASEDEPRVLYAS